MNDLASRIARLPPEKRALLEARLLTGREPGAAAAIPRRPAKNPTPLSFAQRRLWFLDRLDPGTPLYNVPEVLALRGALDVSALERTIREILLRHEVLRSRFGGGNGEPLQMTAEDAGFSLTVTDLAALPEGRRAAEARALAEQEGDLPFDLERGPLFRARLLRLARDEHWLLLTLHHIVSDEWSMGVLYREIGELYGEFREGREPVLPELPIQYGDYAVWQRQGRHLEDQLAYWKKTLAGELPLLALPGDRPRPPERSYRGDDVRHRLSAGLSRRLEALSRQQGATLFMTLLAAFFAFLARICDQDDILVGTPIAGRTRVETEGLIGFFVNTLVLRGDLSRDPTFREHLQRVRETAMEAYAHQEVPFERVVEEVRPERSLSHTPLFQAMFELDNGPAETPDLPDLEVTAVELPDNAAKFDLRLLAIGEESGLLLVFEYATDLFDRATVARLAGHFETMLDAIVADPEQPVSRLPLLSEQEKRRILFDWNQTREEYPREKCLHELFQDQAARSPEAVAVEFEGESLTYRELARNAGRLARYLQGLGVRPGVLVGLCVPRSLEMAVGLLGVLEAGGAYVPLDPTYPADRLTWMLADSGARVLLTVETLRDALPAFSGRIVRLDADREQIFSPDAGPEIPEGPGATPEDLAYVMYTSGSTGRPKGVMIPHRGLVNYLSWCLRAYDVAEGSGAPVQSSLSFDLTVTGLYAPLLCGRRVRLLPEGFTEELGRVLREEGGFSLVKMTPARLDLLTQQLQDHDVSGCARALVIGGEPLRAESLGLWRDRSPQTAVFNEYGPTETVVGCCVYRVRHDDPRTGSIPIGRPIANTRLYVLDPRGEPVPIGIAGELYIGGDGVATGYWNQPDRTAERFVPDPFGSAGGRLYKTGDRARYRADGNLEFLGRADDQVKIRGFRVELGEVEAALRGHPSVRDAAAAVVEDAARDRRLVGYVVPQDGPAWSAEAVRKHLLARLPEFMVPAALVPIPAIPLTKNGKVDRKALPAADFASRPVEEGYEPPQDALELHLVKIWESLLHTAPIGCDDDFFDLGGHSLLAVRLFAEIEKATGRKLPLATLFRAPTVRQIADLLRDGGGPLRQASLVPIQARGSRPPFFCVHAAGGGVLPYRALSQRLGPDQPFYGLQARGMDEGAAPLTRIEEMADHYLAEIRSLQPEGPYYLGGHSAGGLVAFEMACRLRAQGERVALVALFDTWAPGHGHVIPEKFVRAKLSALRARLLRFSRGLRDGGVVGYLREKFAIRLRVALGRKRDLPPELREVHESIEKAIRQYQPGVYPGTLTLFRAKRQPPEYALDRTLGWSAFSSRAVEVHTVPGYHGEIVDEPQAAILAEKMHECLDRAVEREQELEARRDEVAEA